MTATLIALTLAPACYLDGAATIPQGYDSLLSPQLMEALATGSPELVKGLCYDPSKIVPPAKIPAKTLAFSQSWMNKVLKGLSEKQVRELVWKAYKGTLPTQERMVTKWSTDEGASTWVDTIYRAEFLYDGASKETLDSESDAKDFLARQVEALTNLPDLKGTRVEWGNAKKLASKDGTVWLFERVLFDPVPSNGGPVQRMPATWESQVLLLTDGRTIWIHLNLWTEDTWKHNTPGPGYLGGPFKSRFDP